MTTTRLTQIAEDMARRATGRVLDYETPVPVRSVREQIADVLAWCHDEANGLLFCLGMAAVVLAGSLPSEPVLAGALLTAAAVMWMVATFRWAYGRPGRW